MSGRIACFLLIASSLAIRPARVEESESPEKTGEEAPGAGGKKKGKEKSAKAGVSPGKKAEKKPGEKVKKVEEASEADSPGEVEESKGAEESKGKEALEPMFRTAKSAEAFRKARELFDLKNYSEALASMKRLRDHTKTAADRTVVERWIKGCEGGALLERYQKMADRGVLQRTFFSAMDQALLYRGTPVAPLFAAFLDETMPRVVQVLENFDVASNRYSAKFGKRFENNPAIVFRGAHCLEWSSQRGGKASQLVLKDVPQKWTPFHSVVFWIRCEQPVELQLLVLNPASSNDEETSALEASYNPPPGGRWVRAEVPLDQFKKHGSASFGNVGRFAFQIDSQTAYKFYIDEVGLVKKDSPGSAAGAGDKEPGEEKDQKQGKADKKSKKGPSRDKGKKS